MGEPLERVWGYGESEDTEEWQGAFASREEAIAEGAVELDAEEFWILQGVYPDPGDVTPSAEHILEEMAETAHDNWGDLVSEDYPDVSDAGVAELDDLLKAWARKHCKSHHWVMVGKPEKIDLKGGVPSASDIP